MTRLVKLREKGQVTLPREIRNQLGLQQGDVFEVSVDNDRIVLHLVVHHRERPAKVPLQLLGGLVGMVTLGGDAVKDSARYDE